MIVFVMEQKSVKTSQPSAGEFAMLYEKLGKEYDSIIAIHVSKSLSGTLSSSISGAEIAQVQVEFIDSLSLSAGITGLVEKGSAITRSRSIICRNCNGIKRNDLEVSKLYLNR